MEMITIYAVVCGNEVAIEQSEILNKANKTDSYKVVSCNGLIILK